MSHSPSTIPAKAPATATSDAWMQNVSKLSEPVQRDVYMRQLELENMRGLSEEVQKELYWRRLEIERELGQRKYTFDETWQAVERESKIRSTESYARMIIALTLVLFTFGLIFYGMWRDITAEEIARYVSPVTGFAGIAIGYLFSQSTSKTSSSRP